ncbi:MAG: hypothetical protein HeimC3_40300 [Candidatus Heimdallarchaeota archaeon LC_3]|nr:MAG: hypothetical protein HeimC3_40300 [Candidatus Heimdallarchaeota archaeon LC_3]
MDKLRQFHPFCYGSIARGDIELSSDSDIIIDPTPSYKYELLLKEKWLSRTIIQATPNHGPKTVYEFPNKMHLTVPFTNLSQRESEFLNFGGKLSLPKFQNGEFSSGINKRLMLVESQDKKGFTFKYIAIKSMPIHLVARKVNVGVGIILERIRVLSKRDEIGRTGLFIKHILNPGDQPEGVLRELASKNSELRKALGRRKYRL